MILNESFLLNVCHNTAIDSLSVLTPVNKVKLPENFVHNLITINENTGEIVDNKTRPVIDELNGIKIRCEIRNLFGEEYLTTVLTSKMLFQNYFHGIKQNNFFSVFDYYRTRIGLGISFSDFMEHSKTFDIDVKTDFNVNDLDYDRFLVTHKNLPTARFFRSRAKKYLDRALNNGMQLVNRKDASIGKPFVKFYSKYDELLERSNEFAMHYNVSCSFDLRRLEVTLKNSEHIKSHGYSNKLTEIINLSTFDLRLILYKSYYKHFPNSFVYTPAKLNTHLSLQDWTVCVALFTLMMDSKNNDLNSLLNEFVSSYPSITDQSKSRKIRQLKEKMKVFIEIQKLFDMERFKETGRTAFM